MWVIGIACFVAGPLIAGALAGCMLSSKISREDESEEIRRGTLNPIFVRGHMTLDEYQRQLRASELYDHAETGEAA